MLLSFLDQQTKLPNPFKKTTALDSNCFAKALMVTVGGGAMGFVMAMFMNAVEYRELSYGRTKQSTRSVFRKDLTRMTGMAKGFAVFGCFFSIFECQLEKIRVKDDAFNSFIGGGFTPMLLGAGNLGWKGMMWTGLGGGMFGMLMFKVQMAFMHK